MAAGLRAGDVVEQVNGTTVDAGTNARDLLAQAMQAGTAQVVINRAGQRIALTLAVH
jgi:type II secretory pathway component PulC